MDTILDGKRLVGQLAVHGTPQTAITRANVLEATSRRRFALFRPIYLACTYEESLHGRRRFTLPAQ